MYLDIGQYGGFELGDINQNAHGQATYRLRIFDEPHQVMTLQIPEIYSAYKLYINGQLYYQSGEVEKENIVHKFFLYSHYIYNTGM